MNALAYLLGCTSREAACFIVACPVWLFGTFLAIMNWLIALQLDEPRCG